MTLFVDTSALYAVLDRDDGNHLRARTQWRELLELATPLCTSNYVLVEMFALTQRRLGMEAVRGLSVDILPVIEVVWAEPEDHRAALAALLAANRRDLSFVDCLSFQLMRRLHLSATFSFDNHFAEQGFGLRN